MDAKRYTLTVYAAAPGTPIRTVGNDGTDTFANSVPGHVYYGISDGGKPESWGFAPEVHGSVNGPGIASKGDADNYVDPIYARTMEISKEQYERLQEFGNDPKKFGFDMNYKDIRNNCVDFTWSALNHAGIQRTHGHIGHLQPHGVEGKGSYLPIGAPNDFRTIRDPFPGSDLSRETLNQAPSREWWQAPFGDFDRTLSQANDDPFDRLVAAAQSGNDKAFDDVGEDFLQSYEGKDFLETGLEHNRQQELADQALAQQQMQQQQQQQQQAPAMAMSM